jgi:tetratricopeptide (TPR) repeat protein
MGNNALSEGYACHGRGDLQAAVQHYRRAVREAPLQFDGHRLLGLALLDLGRPEEALLALDLALGLRPGHLECLGGRARCALHLGRYEVLADAADRILNLAPDRTDALHWRAAAHLEMGAPQRALQCLEQALLRVPDSPDLLQDKALALSRLFRRDEALVCLERSVQLRPPVEQDLHRLALLVELGRDADVVVHAGRLLERFPARQELLITLGWAQFWLGNTRAGVATLEQAVDFADPNDGSVRLHAAHAHLLLGDLARGWERNEARFLGGRPAVAPRQVAPRWQGSEPLRDRTIAVLAEQGLGDALQFCRYVPLLTALGARVLLEAPVALHGVLASLGPGVTLLAPGAATRADRQCPLMSLPQAFDTRIDTIPSAVPYLSVPADRSRIWSERLGAATRLRVGLACTGNARHNADRRRSLPYAELRDLLALDCEFHLLQLELRAQDAAQLADTGVVDHRAHIRDLADTAALIGCMDLVICVDTAIAHLAGALGRPLWLLLAKPSDWRWLLGRDDSPWYPSARLFRMQERGNWAPVVDAVRTELALRSARHAAAVRAGTRAEPALAAAAGGHP